MVGRRERQGLRQQFLCVIERVTLMCNPAEEMQRLDVFA
jgi:hypothetical protein